MITQKKKSKEKKLKLNRMKFFLKKIIELKEG
jgi:hypothetical protein